MSKTQQLPFIHEKVANAASLSPELARLCLSAISPIKRQRIQQNPVADTDASFMFPSIARIKEAKMSNSSIVGDDNVNVVSAASFTLSLPRLDVLRLAVPNVFKPLPHKHEMQSPKPIVSARVMKRRRSSISDPRCDSKCTSD